MDVCGTFWKPLESYRSVGFRHIQRVIYTLEDQRLEPTAITFRKENDHVLKAGLHEGIMFRPFIFEGLVFRMSTKRPMKSVIFFSKRDKEGAPVRAAHAKLDSLREAN